MNKYQEALERLGAEKLARGQLIRNDDKVEYWFKLLKELVDKEKTKKPIIDSGVTYCPRCHWVVELTFVHNNNNNRGLVLRPDKYCHNCGQRLREE